MKILLHPSHFGRPLLIAAIGVLMLICGLTLTTYVQAASTTQSAGQRLITVHDEGQDRGILTHATTLREAFREANIRIDPNDLVEPGLDEPLAANNYEVNIYRARPVTIVDGTIREKVMSPYQTAKQIAQQANITLHNEDTTSITENTDIVSEGTGVQMKITRATPFTLVLYGTKTTAYTQAKSVSDMLSQKGIKLGVNDTLSVPTSAQIQAGMVVELWRNGSQTATEEQDIAFTTQQIQNADQPVGYKQVQTPGVVGKKTVTYEIVMKNGQEVSRTEIQNVVILQPVQQVEVVGSKPTFSGDFAAALAKLRSCEGGYSSWNPAGPYYGAYQFDHGTWNSVSSAPYGSATPAEQDAAAYALYLRRGWHPWPVCGSSLPDIYR